MRWPAQDFKLATDQGYGDAQSNYGICLQNGEGVSKDLKEPVTYFKLAADQGNAGAQGNYGTCLQKGEGV
jgi:TPR repeat protein